MVQDSDKSSKDVKKVSAQCKKQVKYELMVQSENIELNSPLYEACKKDLQTFCPDVAHDQGKAEECLRRNRKKLQSHDCRELLFQEEEIESNDRDLDYTFMHVCKRMIKKYCMHPSNTNGILECLRDHIRDPEMDKKCHDVIKEREEEAAESIVLDPELVSECKADIHKFCKELEDKYMRPGKEKPDDGLVFECLVDALQDKMVGCN
jgi:Golgi apparatus protein 1